MQLADLLTPERIIVPMRAGDLREGLYALLERVSGSGLIVDSSATENLPAALEAGDRGEILWAGPEVVVVAARTEAVDDLSVALGIVPEPFSVVPHSHDAGDEADEAPKLVRAVLLLLTPRRLSTLKVQVLPAIVRVLRDEERRERLLAAETASDVRSFQELMGLELHERLLVEDALTPLTYRIYPDTPVSEVVDLMVRRGLRAVPVVGEKYEVLGVITAGDALKHLLPRRMSGGEGDPAGADRVSDSPPLTSRDVMSRSVLCVSEDQSLLEAANMMVNKDFEQLPVVREGELIGFVTREAILGKLFG